MSRSKNLKDFEPLRRRAELLEEYVEFLTRGLRPAIQCIDEDHSVYRFPAPDIRHYCALQLSSAVGSLNAALQLAEGGYWQEVCILVRIVIEATTHIDWMLHSQDGSESDREKSGSYLEAYFSDHDRKELPDVDPAIRQKEVHRVIAGPMDKHIRAHGLEKRPAGELLYTVYKRFSFYIHNRYPELMDRYDGGLQRFTLSGDRNPQKDQENFDIIETYLDSTNLCALHIAKRFDLVSTLLAHPTLSSIVSFELGVEES